MKPKTDALIKEATRIRDEAIDDCLGTEEEFAADIANYLSDVKHTGLRRCHWCGRIISDRRLTVVSDVEFVFVCTDCLDWERGEDGNILVTRLNAKAKIAEPETPIYETLAPGECLIISKDENSLLVACNNGGKVVVKRVVTNLTSLDEIAQGIWDRHDAALRDMSSKRMHFGSKIDDAGTLNVKDYYQ